MHRILLDTCVLWNPAALIEASHRSEPAFVPAIAYTERARQIQAAGRDAQELDLLLDRNRIDIEPYEAAHGLRYAARLHDDESWHRLSRDAMIAGHVGPGDELWTANPDDFLAVGVPAAQIRSF